MAFGSKADVLKDAAKLLPGSELKATALGRPGFRMTTAAWAYCAVLVALAIAERGIIFPGLIGLFLFRDLAQPRRSVVVTSASVAVLKRSLFTGNVKSVLGTYSFADLQKVKSGSVKRVRVVLGDETLAFSAADYQALLAPIENSIASRSAYNWDV